MTAPAQPYLRAGSAYRTRDLARWSTNPTRLARRLVCEGKLCEAAHGIYYVPLQSKFGPAPVTDEVLLQALCDFPPAALT